MPFSTMMATELSNAADDQSGTDPQDANDALRLQLRPTACTTWTATFQAQSNRTYTVQAAENLGHTWHPLLHVLAAPTNRTVQRHRTRPTLHARFSGSKLPPLSDSVPQPTTLNYSTLQPFQRL